jgi:hypothetical protein
MLDTSHPRRFAITLLRSSGLEQMERKDEIMAYHAALLNGLEDDRGEFVAGCIEVVSSSDENDFRRASAAGYILMLIRQKLKSPQHRQHVLTTIEQILEDEFSSEVLQSLARFAAVVREYDKVKLSYRIMLVSCLLKIGAILESPMGMTKANEARALFRDTSFKESFDDIPN